MARATMIAMMSPSVTALTVKNLPGQMPRGNQGMLSSESDG